MAGPFFVDFDNGNDTNDGLGIGAGNAWATLGKAADTIGDGETVFVRANMTDTETADILFDTAGVTVIGADAVTNDPWSDASDVLPKEDFNGGTFQIKISSANRVRIERIHVFNSHDTLGNLQILSSQSVGIDGCKLEDGTRHGMTATNATVLVQDTAFLNNGDDSTTRGSVDINGCSMNFQACTFDPFSNDRRTIQITGAASIVFDDCDFDDCDEFVRFATRPAGIRMRNCTFGVGNIENFTAPMPLSGMIVKGMLQQIALIDGTNMDAGTIDKARQWAFQYAGERDSDVAYARSGGSVQGWRFQAGANCNADAPLVLTYFINVNDTDSHNYSMFCKFQANAFDKGSDLDETEIFFTITELKADGTIVQTAMGATTWDFDNTSTWQEGAVTAFSASSAGTLRIDVFVASPGGDVYIDTPVGEAGAGNEGYADGGLIYNLANVGGGGGGGGGGRGYPRGVA